MCHRVSSPTDHTRVRLRFLCHPMNCSHFFIRNLKCTIKSSVVFFTVLRQTLPRSITPPPAPRRTSGMRTSSLRRQESADGKCGERARKRETYLYVQISFTTMSDAGGGRRKEFTKIKGGERSGIETSFSLECSP